MKFDPGKYEVMKKEGSLDIPDGEYQIGVNKLQESKDKGDLRLYITPNLSLERHMRRIVRDTNYILVNIIIISK